MFDFEELMSVSPIDGRYRSKTEPLRPYFSEWALIKYRLQVEIEYFIAMVNHPLPQLAQFPKEKIESLRNLYVDFDAEQANRIKQIERETNHDVKAVEYYLKSCFDELDLALFKEFIHFGLTSQDVNNTAMPKMLQSFTLILLEPELNQLHKSLLEAQHNWKHIPMMSRTHGQAATPTTLGKEIGVFAYRLGKQLQLLRNYRFSGKFGGATGNFNAHRVAYPQIDWNQFSDQFLTKQLGLKRQNLTTQIDNYDDLAEFLQLNSRINTILLDLCADVWSYVSLDYFKQRIKAGEIGSSAMPHKVNPIDFENAEGNLGLSNALSNHLAGKLPISRLQRDLTDSTVTRNIGACFAYQWIALQSLKKGIGKIYPNPEKIEAELNDHWELLSEAIQTILRREGYPNPYEALKKLTRKGEKTTASSIAAFIDDLEVSDAVKSELHQLKPDNYLGYANL